MCIRDRSGADITITSGTSVVFSSALQNGDLVDIVAYGTFNVTTINASNINSGTLNDARLPTTISDKIITTTSLTAKGDGSSADGKITLNCSQNSHGVKIQSPAHSAAQSYTLILPTSVGSNGQVLATSGASSNQLSWIDATETKPTVANVSQTIAPATATTISITGTAVNSRAYTNITSGQNLVGAAATFNITVNYNNSYTVTQGNEPGTNYANGNTIIVAGNNLGGTTPANDLTITVTGVNAGTGIQGGGGTIVASQNIPWDVLTPQIQSQLEPRTGMVARVQGTSATSCGPFPAGSSAETSFIKDSDFQDVTIGEENYFPATKLVANQLNEINRMNSVKSLTLELNLDSEVSHLSPVIDLTRCDMITTANIINNIEPTEGIGGECAGNYITKVARLEKSATGLKVMLAANTFTQSKIVVMYKLVPVGYTGNLDELEFRFFNSTGVPDNGALIPQNDLSTFTDYEYTIEDSDEFDGFQVNEQLVSNMNDEWRFMHCLPAHRGDEVTDWVMDHKNSIVFDQAENRMWAQMSLLTYLVNEEAWETMGEFMGLI